MKANELVVGRKYRSTAFARKVKLISVDKVYEDGMASVTVEYYGKLYSDCSFRFSI
jgi:hypothetical protein